MKTIRCLFFGSLRAPFVVPFISMITEKNSYMMKPDYGCRFLCPLIRAKEVVTSAMISAIAEVDPIDRYDKRDTVSHIRVEGCIMRVH